MRRMAFLLVLWPVLWAEAAGAARMDARLEWARRAELGVPVSGRVSVVHVSPGDRVTRGQPLVLLDERRFAARLKRAEARRDETVPRRDEAARERERARELYEATLLSDHDLQLAEIAWTSADAAYREADAEVREAELELEYSVLRAPFDGRVVAVHAAPGQVVAARCRPPVLIVLADDRRMDARAWVDASVAGEFAPGGPAVVRVGGRDFRGVVRQVSWEPRAERGAQQVYALDVRFDAGDGADLRAGQPAIVELP